MEKRARENIRKNVAVLLSMHPDNMAVKLNEPWAKAIGELIDQVDELEIALAEAGDHVDALQVSLILQNDTNSKVKELKP